MTISYTKRKVRKLLFLIFLTDMTSLFRDLEKVRCELSLRNDFTLQDIFKLFDQDKCGSISIDNLKYGFNLFEVFPTNEEISIILDHYNKHSDSKMNLPEFSSIFLPYDNQHAFFLSKRASFNFKNYISLFAFSVDTKMLVQKLFNFILLFENKLEKWRQKLEKCVDLSAIFNNIDKNNQQFIIFEDIKKYFHYHRINHKNSDIIISYQLLDPQGKNRITFDDFKTELSPKTKDYDY